MLDAMRAFGAPAKDIEAVEAALQQPQNTASPELEEFGVYHDNWLIVQTFQRCQTQWQRVGMAGVRSGLYYPGVDIVVRRLVPKKSRACVWDGLQTMELAVLAYDSEQDAKE